MASGEVPRSLFYGDKISLRPAGTATLVCNLDLKCRILRKHDTDGKSSNKPGECPLNPLYVLLGAPRICETELLRVENRYSALELLCEECIEIDCSNASHDSSIQASISYFDSDIACTDSYARLHSEHKGLHVANVNICHIKPKLDAIKLLLNSSSKLDILGICETFFDVNTDDNILKNGGLQF